MKVHTVRGTAGHLNEVVEANGWQHEQKTDVFANAGHQGAHKRPDVKNVRWHAAMRLSLCKLPDKAAHVDALTRQVERIKASTRSKVEHPFGHEKVRYRSMTKNTAQSHTLAALVNL